MLGQVRLGYKCALGPRTPAPGHTLYTYLLMFSNLNRNYSFFVLMLKQYSFTHHQTRSQIMFCSFVGLYNLASFDILQIRLTDSGV